MERTERVYRAPRGQGGWLLGLCAGLGAHLGVDPLVVRIVFLLLLTVPMGGLAVALIYLVFGLVTPMRPVA